MDFQISLNKILLRRTVLVKVLKSNFNGWGLSRNPNNTMELYQNNNIQILTIINVFLKEDYKMQQTRKRFNKVIK